MLDVLFLSIACIGLSVAVILLARRVSRLESLCHTLYESIPKF